jgi:ABC-2 type transport system ATP-binding protein
MQKGSSSVVLHVDRLTKTFPPSTRGVSPFVAVNGISFDLYEGEILGVLGANGAGKTTTIQMLLSTLTPTSGVIEYFGKDFGWIKKRNISF